VEATRRLFVRRPMTAAVQRCCPDDGAEPSLSLAALIGRQAFAARD